MTTDDELIEAMLVAMYDDGCPGAVDSMRAVLAVVRAHDRDGERYRWLRAQHVVDERGVGHGDAWCEVCRPRGDYSDMVIPRSPDALDAAIDAAMRVDG